MASRLGAFLLSRRSWAIRTLAAGAVIFAAGWIFSTRYSLGYDPQLVNCLHARVLLIDNHQELPVTPGDIFAYRAKQSAPVYPVGTLMAKHVSGFPGDTVEIDAQERVLVNGQVVAQGLPQLKTLDSRSQKKFSVVNPWGRTNTG